MRHAKVQVDRFYFLEARHLSSAAPPKTELGGRNEGATISYPNGQSHGLRIHRFFCCCKNCTKFRRFWVIPKTLETHLSIVR